MAGQQRKETTPPLGKGKSRHREPRRAWADRPLDETLLLRDPEWSSDEEQHEPKAKRAKRQTSKATAEIVKTAFTKSLTNSERRETRGHSTIELDLPHTRCPRTDAIFKATESNQMQVDGDLQKIQAYMLDDVSGPLMEMLTDDPMEDAISLLDNAIAQTSKIRRKRILKEWFFRGGRSSYAQRGGGRPYRDSRDQNPQMGPYNNRFGSQSYFAKRRGTFQKIGEAK